MDFTEVGCQQRLKTTEDSFNVTLLLKCVIYNEITFCHGSIRCWLKSGHIISSLLHIAADPWIQLGIKSVKTIHTFLTVENLKVPLLVLCSIFVDLPFTCLSCSCIYTNAWQRKTLPPTTFRLLHRSTVSGVKAARYVAMCQQKAWGRRLLVRKPVRIQNTLKGFRV